MRKDTADECWISMFQKQTHSYLATQGLTHGKSLKYSSPEIINLSNKLQLSQQLTPVCQIYLSSVL